MADILKSISDLEELVAKEIDKVVATGKLDPPVVHTLYEAMDVVKDGCEVYKLKMMGEDAMGDYYENGSRIGRPHYMDRYSQTRYRNSMGQFSSRTGAMDQDTSDLEAMLSRATDPRKRMVLQNALNEMRM